MRRSDGGVKLPPHAQIFTEATDLREDYLVPALRSRGPRGWVRVLGGGAVATGLAVAAWGLPGAPAEPLPLATTAGSVQPAGPGVAVKEPVGPPVVYTGNIGGVSVFDLAVSPRYAGDLLVVTVVNEGLPQHVTSVSGGGVASWSATSAPFVDGADGQVLQIWYGTVTSVGAAHIAVNWSDDIADADVTAQEFTIGAPASWALEAEGTSASPFPVLTAPPSGDLYVGAATASGNAASGATHDVTYTVPDDNFVYATDPGAYGAFAPAAAGAGAVAALFSATALAGPGGGGAATTTTTPPAATTTTVTATTVPGTPGSQTVGSMWPSSMFNSDVQNWPVDANSSVFAQDFVSDYQSYFGSVGVNTMPIYSVPANQPEATFSVSSGCNDFTSDTGTQVPVPSFASLNGSSDNPLVIYQPSTSTEWEFWRVVRNSPTSYSACWGGKLDMNTSDGVFPPNFGLSATGISYLATTITEADVASGSIDHAIAFILPRCNHYVYPADRGDCGSDPGQPGEGQWFRFAPGTQMPSGLAPFAQMVFKAILTYGMVVVDQGGAVMLEAEQQSDWAAQGHTGTDPITASCNGLQEYQVVANLPWSSLQAVDP